MKTSFYFVLWIGMYLLIDLFGSRGMQENSFYVALFAVLGFSSFVNNLTAPQRANMASREAANLMEIVYVGDYPKFISIFRRRFLFNLATFVYFAISVIFLLMIKDSWVVIAIFAFLALAYARGMTDSYKKYADLKEAGSIELDEEAMEEYNRYKEMRESVLSPEQLLPPVTWQEKLLSGCNIGFSALSAIIGMVYLVIFIPGLVSHGAMLMGSVMLMAYGGLALIYGINDLVTSIKEFN